MLARAEQSGPAAGKGFGLGQGAGFSHADTRRMRTNAQGLKPFVMTNLKTLEGLAQVVDFIVTRGMLAPGAAAGG